MTEVTAERICGAISFGGLMGARGNSGVITSQVFRGMAEALGGKSRFNGRGPGARAPAGPRPPTARSRSRSRTILTVIREAADAAVATAEDQRHRSRPRATVEAAEKSVARTPSLCRSCGRRSTTGGQGLFRLFQGALHHLRGLARSRPLPRRRSAAAAGSTLAARIDEGFGYETMFLLQAHPGKPLDVDAIRDHLESIGESVLVAGDARALKVHVHNERPDEVIGYGLGLGSLSPKNIVENLDKPARDVQEARDRVHRVSEQRRSHRDSRDLDERGVDTPSPGPRSSPSSPATAWPRSTRNSASTRS